MGTVRLETREGVTTVTLDRPDARNAFDERVIADLTAAFSSIPAESRAVVVAGAGPTFCAGADAAWMKRSKEYTEEQNARDAYAMAAMLRAIDECPRPVIARVQGAALGGGSGLVAACDVAIAAEGAQFGFTEVRLGLVPAVISTFVLPRIGTRAARRYFLTGERFGAEEARAIGLVHEVVKPDALDARVEALTREFFQCAPQAVAAAKRLIREASALSREEAIDYTVRTIARIRVSPEAQEGLGAFLEKRKPSW
ncbi:MAG: enoyl-CoA hydratase-related protein [Gammaproteobacteria bacterium]